MGRDLLFDFIWGCFRERKTAIFVAPDGYGQRTVPFTRDGYALTFVAQNLDNYSIHLNRDPELLNSDDPAIIIGRPSAISCIADNLTTGMLAGNNFVQSIMHQHYETMDNRYLYNYSDWLVYNRIFYSRKAKGNVELDHGFFCFQKNPARLLCAGPGALGTLAAVLFAAKKRNLELVADVLERKGQSLAEISRLYFTVEAQIPDRRGLGHAVIPDGLSIKLMNLRTDLDAVPHVLTLECHAVTEAHPVSYIISGVKDGRDFSMPLFRSNKPGKGAKSVTLTPEEQRVFEDLVRAGHPLTYRDLDPKDPACARVVVARIVDKIDAGHWVGLGSYVVNRLADAQKRRGLVSVRINERIRIVFR